MAWAELLVGVLIGAVTVGFVSFVWLRQLTSPLRVQVAELSRQRLDESMRRQEAERQLAGLQATLEAEQRAAAERLRAVQDAEKRLSDTFQALASDVLRSNSSSFLELAKLQMEGLQKSATAELEQRQTAIGNLVKPITETLQKVEARIQEVEKVRSEEYSGLLRETGLLAQSQEKLRVETEKLGRSLRAPAVRGRWGEIQLRRVVELAGMLEYCDFTLQERLVTEDGARRPDMVVRLPNARSIAVDSKVPLDHYLSALECADEEQRRGYLAEHARQIRRHLQELGAKSYWDRLDHSPEFVVLFLPGEVFFSAALEQDGQLIEYGIGERVILATPTTLIALLKAVAYGWKQEQVARSAQQISALGRDLHKRLASLATHFANLGKGLERAVGAYNNVVGSLETRVLVSARRFRELGAGSEKDIPPVPAVETAVRPLVAAQTLEESDESENLPLLAE